MPAVMWEEGNGNAFLSMWRSLRDKQALRCQFQIKAHLKLNNSCTIIRVAHICSWDLSLTVILLGMLRCTWVEQRREHRFEHGFRAPQSRIRGHESIFVDAQFYFTSQNSEGFRSFFFSVVVTFSVCLNGFNNFFGLWFLVAAVA